MVTTYRVTGWSGSPATSYKIFEPPQGSTITVSPDFLKKLIYDPNISMVYNRDSDRKLIWKWLSIDETQFYTPAPDPILQQPPINYTPAEPINYTPAEPINYTPAPPVTNPTTPIFEIDPEPVAPTVNKAYQIEVILPYSVDYLEVPGTLMTKLSPLALKFGWYVHACYASNGKIYIDVEKIGSIALGTLLLIIGAVVAAVLLVKIVSITVTQLGTAYSETVQSNNIKSSVNKVIEYCNAYGVSSEECQELVNGVKTVYETNEIQQPPTSSGSAWGAGALIVGVLALAALSKK